MLYICNDITKFPEFYEKFQKTHETKRCIDLSKVFTWDLADECDSIIKHHRDCIIFLGYLEPGWMLDSPSQTRLRKLFRKFDVGIITNFSLSLPFSWKNEIDIIYSSNSTMLRNGEADTIDYGCLVQHKP